MYLYEWKQLCISHEHDSIEASWECSGSLGDFKFPEDHTSDCRSFNRLGFEMHRMHFAMLIWSNYKNVISLLLIWFSVLIQGPKLLSKYQVKACPTLQSSPDVHLFKRVKTGLLYLLKKRIYFASEVSTPYFYVIGKYNFFQLIIKSGGGGCQIFYFLCGHSKFCKYRKSKLGYNFL